MNQSLRPFCIRSTPEEGGETVFPQGKPAVSGPGWSDCAKEVHMCHLRSNISVQLCLAARMCSTVVSTCWWFMQQQCHKSCTSPILRALL